MPATAEMIEAGWEKAKPDGVCDQRSHKERFVEGLNAALAATPPPEAHVGVKSLDWESSENVGLEWAESVVGQYRVHCGFEMDGKSYGPAFRFPADSEWTTCASLEDAKGESQKNYEARILSALNPAPQTREAGQ